MTTKTKVTKVNKFVQGKTKILMISVRLSSNGTLTRLNKACTGP